jgi:hypothetical protein
MSATSSIPIKTTTKIELKKMKVDLESKLSKEITWDEFFNQINIDFKESEEVGR